MWGKKKNVDVLMGLHGVPASYFRNHLSYNILGIINNFVQTCMYSIQ